jgi:hypothetical protein
MNVLGPTFSQDRFHVTFMNGRAIPDRYWTSQH